MSLKEELKSLINKYSQENKSNTPDSILSEYLVKCLEALNKAVNARTEWYGKSKLQLIYDSEINFSISTFWDGGFTVKLGDEVNGFIAERVCDTFEECVSFLIEKVRKHYPKSLL